MPAERSSARRTSSARSNGSGSAKTSKSSAATRKKAATNGNSKAASARATKKQAAKKKATVKQPASKRAAAKKATGTKATAKKATAVKKAATKKAATKKSATKTTAGKTTTAARTQARHAATTSTTGKQAGTTKGNVTKKSTVKGRAAAGGTGNTDTDATIATEPRRRKGAETPAALPSGEAAERTEAAELMRRDGAAPEEQDLDAEAELEEETVEEEDEDLDVEPPDEEIADVSTEDLWEAYGKESERLLAEMAAEMGVAKGSPEVTSRKREITSPELEALRNELIERHYPLVRYIAERLLQTLPKSIELDDLISAGQFGLMDAIRGFDPERGIKFKTYCSTRIRGSILDQLRSQDWVPRLVRIKWSRIERALQQLTGEYGREPTHSELARVLGMTHDELAKELNESQAKAMFSLSEKWDDDEDGSVEKVEVLEDKESIDPVNELNRRDLMKYITRSLTHKERFIIEQYYQYGHTMREIGEMLALTESRVCQIHSNVMGRLKGLLVKRTESLHN